MKFSKPAGMKAFTIVWFGQLISFTGSGMSLFALMIIVVGCYGFFSKKVREGESLIPDFDEEIKQAPIV